MKNILVTGSAGFIGSALSIRLLERGEQVTGIDNHNDYHNSALKEGVENFANWYRAYHQV